MQIMGTLRPRDGRYTDLWKKNGISELQEHQLGCAAHNSEGPSAVAKLKKNKEDNIHIY